MMIPQNKNVRLLVWHFYYVDTAVKGSELYCYNTEGDRDLVVNQASFRINVSHETSKFTHDEAAGGFHLVGSGLWTLWRITLKVYEYVRVRYFLNHLYVS